MNERREKHCTTLNCKGFQYREMSDDTMRCTGCDFKTPAKRIDDKERMTLRELKREWEGV